MGKITAVKPQKKVGRFNVCVEGKFAFGVDSLTLVKRNLKVGREVSEKEIEEISREVNFESDLEHILHFLSFRPRSRKELEQYLAKKGLEEEEGEKVIRRVESLGLVDDKKFAEWWVGQRAAFRPKGAKVLKLELKRKGIGKEVIEGVEFSAEDDEEKAFELLKKSWPRWLREPTRKRREKAAGFLGRRGFDWEVIRKAIDRIDRNEVE